MDQIFVLPEKEKKKKLEYFYVFSLMCESIVDQTYQFVRHDIFLFFYVHFMTLWRDTQTTMRSANTNLKISISSKHTDTQAHTRAHPILRGSYVI